MKNLHKMFYDLLAHELRWNFSYRYLRSGGVWPLCGALQLVKGQIFFTFSHVVTLTFKKHSWKNAKIFVFT